ncbi:MAG: polysaccharide deacetylase family protein [Lachnospiraceae bacterium]|nr:polysaccharide deacetylase family protein [Lachnospiraceae bacterium]
MRKLWSILCIAVLCLIFWKMASWHEAVIPVDEQQILTISGEKKQVAITFDDGPHPVCTPRLLDGLRARGVIANFFVIGQNAEQNPEIIRQMEADGHLIGNHTYHHVQLNAMSTEQAMLEVTAVNQQLEHIIGSAPIYLRPPFGEWDHKADGPAEMISVYWDIDPLDWNTPDADVVANRVLSQVEDGDIILLHDVYETSVDAAFLIIDELLMQGYEFVTVEELYFN